MNYNINFYNRTFTVSGKEMADKLEYVFRKITHILQYKKKLSGIIEKPHTQHEYVTMQMFGNVQTFTNEQKEKFDVEVIDAIKSIPSRLSFEDLKKLNSSLNVIFDKYILIEDNRETQASRDEKNKKFNEAKELRRLEFEEKEKSFEFYSPESVNKNEDEMFITIEAYTDNSDPMTDYFDRHHGISNSYAIGIVKKGSKREATARRFVEKIDFLKELNFQWKTENYSMGHGNYLESEVIASILNEKNCYWYEIHFDKFSKRIPKSKYFVEIDPEPAASGSIQIRKNEEKNGIEIKFQSKPNGSILESLKNNGFRWSNYQKIWYSKFTPEKLQFAESFLNS